MNIRIWKENDLDPNEYWVWNINDFGANEYWDLKSKWLLCQWILGFEK